MKSLKTLCRVIFLAILLFGTMPVVTGVATKNIQFKSVSQESQLSPDDWKIVIDEKKSSNEFGFIQKNLDSSNLEDNGKFLLIAGLTLLVLSGVGVIFFSFCLHKLLRKSSQKSNTKLGSVF